MTKQQLKTGHICVHKDGRLSMVLLDTSSTLDECNDYLIFSSSFRTPLDLFSNELKFSESEKDMDIIEIWNPKNIAHSFTIFEDKAINKKLFNLIYTKEN